jgi:hypothetical protein
MRRTGDRRAHGLDKRSTANGALHVEAVRPAVSSWSRRPVLPSPNRTRAIDAHVARPEQDPHPVVTDEHRPMPSALPSLDQTGVFELTQVKCNCAAGVAERGGDLGRG